MSDPLNPAALHVRIVNPDGATEDICSLASFVKNNEHDEIALYALGLALCQAGEDPRDKDACAWIRGGAGGNVGLVIEEGPAP